MPSTTETKRQYCIATSLDFQNPLFTRGYTSCRVKKGINPIPTNWKGELLLPVTDDHRNWMAGWKAAVCELAIITLALNEPKESKEAEKEPQ